MVLTAGSRAEFVEAELDAAEEIEADLPFPERDGEVVEEELEVAAEDEADLDVGAPYLARQMSRVGSRTPGVSRYPLLEIRHGARRGRRSASPAFPEKCSARSSLRREENEGGGVERHGRHRAVYPGSGRVVRNPYSCMMVLKIMVELQGRLPGDSW